MKKRSHQFGMLFVALTTLWGGAVHADFADAHRQPPCRLAMLCGKRTARRLEIPRSKLSGSNLRKPESSMRVRCLTRSFPSGGVLIDMGTLGGEFSEATAVNSKTKAVGYSENGDQQVRAFIWDCLDRKMQDLGTLGGEFSSRRASMMKGWSLVSRKRRMVKSMLSFGRLLTGCVI